MFPHSFGRVAPCLLLLVLERSAVWHISPGNMYLNTGRVPMYGATELSYGKVT